MKTPLDAFTEMTTLGWSMFLGNQPAAPATTPARQAANVREWVEDEGGSVKKMSKPRAKKAAPAKKRKPSRTAKGKAR